jgi:hypothetical protein
VASVAADTAAQCNVWSPSSMYCLTLYCLTFGGELGAWVTRRSLLRCSPWRAPPLLITSW